MRPFDPINNEVEVGYDGRFERRWHYAELAGRAVMLVVVTAALTGLLGRGPYSHHTIGSGATGLAVDYEPVARFGNMTQITFHASPASCGHGMTLRLSSKFIEPMGLQTVIPRPLSSTPLPDGMLLHYDLQPDTCQNAVVRLFAKPAAIGFVPLQAQLNAYPELAWKTFILP
jgi:hypothetical protein